MTAAPTSSAPIAAVRRRYSRRDHEPPGRHERQPYEERCRRDTGDHDGPQACILVDAGEAHVEEAEAHARPDGERQCSELRRHRGVLAGDERDQDDRGDRQRDADERRGPRPLAGPEGVGDRNQRADDRGHRGNEADEASRHRGVEEHDPDPDCDAAPRRPRGVRTRDTLGPDEKGGGNREAESGELRESGDAHGADDTREDPAEEVGPADQERRGDSEERRHRPRGSIAVTTRDPRTSMRPPVARARLSTS